MAGSQEVRVELMVDKLTHDAARRAGPFALIQCLRRRAATGGHRVDTPDIEVDLR
ncbi:hypothetical protein GCM10009751_20240 [Myceligenerans crystallogenes]|uniref:Uncharacterized protein n=1 Tax=Myceligenerans crystallogenes TaxID=316335 RepID=A0ABN2NF72_9MICO